MLREKYERLIRDVDKFYVQKEFFDTKSFVEGIEEFKIYLKGMDDETLSKIDYIFTSYLKLMCDYDNNKKDNENVIYFYCRFLFHYYAIYTKIEDGSDEWVEKACAFDKHMQDYFFEQKKHDVVTYYKNLMIEEYGDYEYVLDLISNQLKRYDTNLYYCKKILKFLDRYYPENVFFKDTFFLKNYIENTIDLMILTITKLYIDPCNVKKRQKCGMKYLQSFIGIKISDKSSIKDILKNASIKINDVILIAKKLELVRNKIIAHFDINEIEIVQNVKMNIDEFTTIYELSCEILELLSLGYFEYKDVFSYKMIQDHGFKFFVCQNPWCHNPNQDYRSDLDEYLKILKENFDDSMHSGSDRAPS